jgi:hypothetical protein
MQADLLALDLTYQQVVVKVQEMLAGILAADLALDQVEMLISTVVVAQDIAYTVAD